MRGFKVARLLTATLAGAIAVSSCAPATRTKVWSLLFEPEIKAPQPVVRPTRRPPPTPVPAAVPVAGLPVPELPEPVPREWRTWLRQLPKDAAGGVDWMRALADKAIEPKAGLDPATPAQPVFPLDVERTPKGQSLFKATFPHASHTQWLTCTNCHTEIFAMKKGAAPITMAKIFAGEYCGRCHGKVAFPVVTGCPRCHLALAPPR
jgi:c(7)-type cytochrome triheme protein